MMKLLFFISFFSFKMAFSQTQYTYDNLHRLTKVQYSNGASIQYSYDANGNRLSETRTASSARPAQQRAVVKQPLLTDGIFSLYPNPVRSILNIKGIPGAKETYRITIINSAGAPVKQWEKTCMTQLNVADLPAGTYLLMIDDKVYRFVKQ